MTLCRRCQGYAGHIQVERGIDFDCDQISDNDKIWLKFYQGIVD